MGEKVVVRTNPENPWYGRLGLVDIQGMRFRVAEEKSTNGNHTFCVVYVVSAPMGTPLAGLTSSNTYVTVDSLHKKEFSSRLKEDARGWATQWRIWGFFDGLYRGLGLKKERCQAVVPEKVEWRASEPTSNSVADLLAKRTGSYSFEKDGDPKAVFCVKYIPHKNNTKALVVEAVSIDRGHLLAEYVRPKAFVFYDQLFHGNPEFKGFHAGATQKIWEYLTDVIADYHRTTPLVVTLGVA